MPHSSKRWTPPSPPTHLHCHQSPKKLTRNFNNKRTARLESLGTGRCSKTRGSARTQHHVVEMRMPGGSRQTSSRAPPRLTPATMLTNHMPRRQGLISTPMLLRTATPPTSAPSLPPGFFLLLLLPLLSKISSPPRQQRREKHSENDLNLQDVLLAFTSSRFCSQGARLKVQTPHDQPRFDFRGARLKVTASSAPPTDAGTSSQGATSSADAQERDALLSAYPQSSDDAFSNSVYLECAYDALSWTLSRTVEELR